MEQDHQGALVHLEREKNLRCERLKAAQVKKNQPKTQFLWSQRTVVKSGLLCRAHWSRSQSPQFILSLFSFSPPAAVLLAGFAHRHSKETWQRPGYDQWPPGEEGAPQTGLRADGSHRCKAATGHKASSVSPKSPKYCCLSGKIMNNLSTQPIFTLLCCHLLKAFLPFSCFSLKRRWRKKI